MSHFEDIERPLYASELFKSFKLNIISNNRSNFLSSEKLGTSLSFMADFFMRMITVVIGQVLMSVLRVLGLIYLMG